MTILPLLGFGLNLQTFCILSIAAYQVPKLTFQVSVLAVEAFASLAATMLGMATKSRHIEKKECSQHGDTTDDLQAVLFKNINKIRDELIIAQREETSLKVEYDKKFQEARCAESVALAADKTALEKLNELNLSLQQYKEVNNLPAEITVTSPETRIALAPEYAQVLCPVMHTITQLSNEVEALISQDGGQPAPAQEVHEGDPPQERMSKMDAIKNAREHVQKISDRLFLAQFRALQETINNMMRQENSLLHSTKAVEAAFSARDALALKVFQDIHALNPSLPPDPLAPSPADNAKVNEQPSGWFASIFQRKVPKEVELRELQDKMDPTFSYRILASEAQMRREAFYQKRDLEAEALSKLNAKKFQILTLKCKKDGLEQMVSKTQVLQVLPLELARPADYQLIEDYPK